MINKKRINEEANAFFEWPNHDKTYVTTTSMLIFVNMIAEMVRAEEREECAKAAEGFADNSDDRKWVSGSLYDTLRRETAASIRKRSNA